METKSDKIRLLSVEQYNAIEHLLQGKSDAATAEAVGVTRQTVWAWRHDPYFAAELNRSRQELWKESLERLKNLVGKALDVMERNLTCGDPKFELMAAGHILKRVIHDEIPLNIGPVTPEDVAYKEAEKEASKEIHQQHPDLPHFTLEDDIKALASKKAKAMLKRQA